MKEPGIPIFIVDAFTSSLFGGNPAAVCPLLSWPEDSLLQSIAAENNLSETAFFVQAEGMFELRWFTPAVEVDLCGHATLATAHVLFNHLDYQEEVINFSTRSGMLKVRKRKELLVMDFPAIQVDPVPVPEQLIKSLGLEPLEALLGPWFYLAVFQDESVIRDLSPDFKAMLKLGRAVIVTSRGNEPVDFVSRFFGPGVGIPEDPVTGSAHSALVPFWAGKMKKNTFHALQVSARGGELFCEHQGERVIIGGRAVTYSAGTAYVSLDP